MKAKPFLLPGLIILWAAVLRLWNYGQMGLSHDEFSALIRTHYNSFSELISKGVITDTHPAGVQVFLWFWVEFSGESSLLIKLPFILMGIASIALCYAVAAHWFGKHTALWTSSFLAVTQMGVLMSQLARPYSPGLFFVLLAAWSWIRYSASSRKGWLIPFSISLAAAAYSHYFALLQAGLLVIVLFVLAERKQRTALLTSAAAAVILFLPYIPSFLFQLKKGGIGTVLGKPNLAFATEYIGILGNYSILFGTLISVGVALSVLRGPGAFLSKKGLLVLSLGLAPAVIGTVYSLAVNPVLMERSLYFSLPFLMMALFAGASHLSRTTVVIQTLLLLSSGTISLVKERKHYEVVYDSGYKGVLKGAHELRGKGIPVYLTGPEEFLEFEARALEIPNDFYTLLQEESGFQNWIAALQENEGSVVLGRTMQFYSPHAGYDALGILFKGGMSSPGNWLNADLRVFSDTASAKLPYRSDLQGEAKNWTFNSEQKSSRGLRFDTDQEWGLVHELDLSGVLSHRNNELAAVLEFETDSIYEGIELVSQLWLGDELIHYSPVILNEHTYPYLSFGMRLADVSVNPKELKWKLIVWNRSLKPFTICNAHAFVLPGNPLQYCWSKPIIRE